MTTWSRKKKRQRTLQAIRIYVLSAFIAVFAYSCKSVKQSAAAETIIIEKETLVPFAVPGDSLTLRALLECDSLNNVLIRGYSEKKSKNMSSSLSLVGGVLSYDAKTQPDTVFVKQTEKSKQLTKTITIRTEKTVYKRGFFFWFGLLSCLWLIVFLILKLSKLFRL